MKTVVKRELGFIIGIEKDLLCLQTLRLDIMINAIRKRCKNKVRYIPGKRYDFSFRFLRINYKGGTLYYDPCRDMRTNANKPSANGRILAKQ